MVFPLVVVRPFFAFKEYNFSISEASLEVLHLETPPEKAGLVQLAILNLLLHNVLKTAFH